MATPSGASAGPAGSGLLPPQSRSTIAPIGGPPDPDDEEDTPLEQDDTADQNDQIDDDLIDSDPPPDDDDTDDAEEEDGQDESAEDMERRITASVEARMQKRFDRAISKIGRRLNDRYRDSDRSDDDDDDDDDRDETPPAPKRRRQRQSNHRSDVTTIRMLARDRITDEMEHSGTAERAAVKKVIDTVVPYVDWSAVDQDDVIDELVEQLSVTATGLIRLGSERKVRQLRNMGALPPASAQPGRNGTTSRKDPVSQMNRGKALAEKRYPGGTRHLGRR